MLDAIRNDIVEGVVPPGSALEVDALAAAHDVSRIPVREALMTLVGEGLVDHQPRRGYTVALLADGELAELFDVRGTLELAALRVAVRLGGPDDVAAARAAHEALQRAAAAGDEREYHHHSRAFHAALTRPSAMPRLLGVFERIWDLTEPYRPMDDLEPREAERLHRDHVAMLEAFTTGDADRLLAVATTHHENLSARVRARPSATAARVPAPPVRRSRHRTLGAQRTGGAEGWT